MINPKEFQNNILQSKLNSTSLVGKQNEIIPYEEWDLKGISYTNASSQLHPHVILTQKEWIKRHKPKSNIALITNCSARKPYSTSKNISYLYNFLGRNYCNKVDRMVISSIGITPIKFEKYYPSAHYAYDGNPDAENLKKYIEIVTERVYNFLKIHHYDYIIGVFKVGGRGKICLKNAVECLPNIRLFESPSQFVYDKIKTNILKMTAFQTHNIEVNNEVKFLIKNLLENNIPKCDYISPSPEKRKMYIKERQEIIKNNQKKQICINTFLK